jgi:hypothetical protein
VVSHPDTGSAAVRALDAARLLGSLAAISDTLLATYFRAGQPPLEVLFKAHTRHLRIPKNGH